MAKIKDQENSARVEAVLELLRKHAPLTVKQEKYCSIACVERFLKWKGNNVKKAAKCLRACLSWRESIGIDQMIADEFSFELAEGMAYVAGQDEESRPIIIIRIKQDYQKFNFPKNFIRLLAFTLEVAMGTMPKNGEQLVILFDASLFRSASAFVNLVVATLKITAEYYPGRLFKCFIIDPPSFFYYLWKGIRPFVELAPATMVVSSLDFEGTLEFNDFSASFLRFDSNSTVKIGSSASSRFAFTVSNNYDSLKPWYLSLTDTSACKVGPTSQLPGPALVSPVNARSFSFASPVFRAPRGSINGGNLRKSFCPSTPLPERTTCQPRTPRPSFLRSPAVFFAREGHVGRTEKCRDAFLPFLRFYRRPYDEMIYRSKMRSPLGGLVSIVSPHLKRRHVSVSQRF